MSEFRSIDERFFFPEGTPMPAERPSTVNEVAWDVFVLRKSRVSMRDIAESKGITVSRASVRYREAVSGILRWATDEAEHMRRLIATRAEDV